MAKYYKTIAADAYLHAFLDEAVRPDGRAFSESRKLRIQNGNLDHVDASCLVSLGSTIVTCAIVVEATDKKPGDTLKDYIDLHTDLPHISRQHLRSTQNIHLSTSLSSTLLSILKNSECVEMKDLYDEGSKSYRRLRCELVVMNDDGSLLDALSLSLALALRQVKLPKVTRDVNTSDLLLERNSGGVGVDGGGEKLVVKDTFITLSFVVLDDDRVLTDATECEEAVVTAKVVMMTSLLRHQTFPLYTRGASVGVIKKCYSLCRERKEAIRALIKITD